MIVAESKFAWTGTCLKKSSILKKILEFFLLSTHNGENIKNLKKNYFFWSEWIVRVKTVKT